MLYTGGAESFISANHFQYPWTWQMISENCISLLWSEEIIVIGYNLVSFQIFPNFMEHMSVLTKCNALFKNEHLILI